MVREVIVACVGKPSAGKSSFLNAGNYPFTTIKPNQGVSYVPFDCPCKRYGKEDVCQPRYGRCINGKRFVPIQMLDVAGLVPGASEGQGLGNQFLDDLRTADALIHVVDVSGTTDAGGKETIGYDPINDIDWLTGEIHSKAFSLTDPSSWVYNNLHKKWGGIVRRHVATKSSVVDTLQVQFSGYGATAALVGRMMDRSGIKTPLESWDDETLHRIVDHFLLERFPTIVALNKIDLADAERNITKIMKKYDQNKLVLTSALAENFLRKMQAQGYLRYEEGTDIVETKEDLPDSDLKPLDEKLKNRIERVQDLVLYRYGSTGVQEVLQKTVQILGMIPVYPVKNIHNFTSGSGQNKGGAFKDCVLVWPGTTVREFAKMLHDEIDKYYLYAETVGNIRLAEDTVITEDCNIIAYRTAPGASSTNQEKT
ncbi:hypothetical protein BZG36_03675 [Bifiguratus adelaidae]|uniref:OBG-type G domain-containing protein n=1 Tax=Bifiguratus adelaidae TaxID=1938954 RepID=A0A261XZR1_9FUNG|nr:hypothetical protein BZG36_03675 [Bifiguratus adelaidae]